MKNSSPDLREVCESKETNKWPNVHLRDICILVNGKAFKPSDWSTSGKPIIRIQNLNDSTKPFNYWDGSLEKQVIVNPGTVLLAWSGTPGTSFGAHIWNREDGVLNQHIFRVDFKRPDISPQWFTYSVNQRLDVLIHQAHGGVGLRHVRKSQVEALEISLPPLSDQKRIAAILNDHMADITHARAAAEEQLEAAEALSAAYLREIFESKEAKQWPKVRLGDHASKIGSGVTPRGGQSAYKPEGIPLIRSQNIYLNKFVQNGLVFIDQEQDQKMRNSRVDKGDVLLNITGASIGRVCVVPDQICPANVNQHVSIIRTDILNPYYLSLYMSNPVFQSFIMNSQSGATRQALTKSMIEDFFIPCPPTKIQSRIVKDILHITKISEKIATDLRLQIQTIDAIPSALLNKAFNGEL